MKNILLSALVQMKALPVNVMTQVTHLPLTAMNRIKEFRLCALIVQLVVLLSLTHHATCQLILNTNGNGCTRSMPSFCACDDATVTCICTSDDVSNVKNFL